MKDTEINIAIAEACGWTRSDGPSLDGHPPSCEWTNPNGHYSFCPDYTSDLNAMAEAEQRLHGTDYQHDNDVMYYKRWHEYQDHLMRNYGASATARQRAEAFLRTIGKWKEEP